MSNKTLLIALLSLSCGFSAMGMLKKHTGSFYIGDKYCIKTYENKNGTCILEITNGFKRSNYLSGVIIKIKKDANNNLIKVRTIQDDKSIYLDLSDLLQTNNNDLNINSLNHKINTRRRFEEVERTHD